MTRRRVGSGSSLALGMISRGRLAGVNDSLA
jgi:hypothetical protein